MKNPINRRGFLKGVGGVAIALPFLEALAPRAARGATGDAPRRFITWITANGTPIWNTADGIMDLQKCPSPVTVVESYNGSDDIGAIKLGEKRDHVFSELLAPLERHRDHMLILEGIRMDGGYAHWQSCPHQLTGRKWIPGSTSGETAAGISLDQSLADHYAGQTRIHSLNLGVQIQPGGDHADGGISWRGPNQEVPVRNNPYQTFAELFQDLPSGGEGAEAFARRIRRKASILDSALDNARSLERRVSAADRQRLAQHMDAIRAVEMQLASSDVPCAAPDQGQPIDYMAQENVPVVLKLQMDIMALALACDLTRVGILQAGQPGGGGRRHSWLDNDLARTEDWHGVSHASDSLEGSDTPGQYVNSRAAEGLTAINLWYYEELAKFVDRLKETPDVDGTSVLDNTVILTTNEYGQMNHEHEDMPYILIGSCGGHFKTGRCLVYNANDNAPGDWHRYHNSLLTEIQNAMGVEGKFGGDDPPQVAMPELSNLIT